MGEVVAVTALIELQATLLPDEESSQPESNPIVSDFSVYKCLQYDKLVIGFELEGHAYELNNKSEVQ